jgi:hypothetical protein
VPMSMRSVVGPGPRPSQSSDDPRSLDSGVARSKRDITYRVHELVLDHPAPFVPLMVKKRGYEAKTVMVAGRRYSATPRPPEPRPIENVVPSRQRGVDCHVCLVSKSHRERWV